MRARAIRPADLGITRLLWIFAILSILLLGALAVAPIGSHYTEWRTAQERYNAQARKAGVVPVGVSIKQIWKPELGVVDRCTSCHLGMGEATPSARDRLFSAHPPLPHDPRELGCTVCHAGQGRATNARAAHGDVRHWNEPMLEKPYLEAGCGTCHSHIRVPAAALAEQGRKIAGEVGCPGCHSPAGGAPDLSTMGLKGFAPGWHDQHVGRAAEAKTPIWKRGFVPLAEEEVAAVDEYLRTLVGAPRLLAGKVLAHQLGCRGCHRIAGVGGDDGPDLSDVGRKAAADLDFAGVRGRRSLAGWLREHFLDPARVVPSSRMPDLGLREEQAELLTVYMLSLRTRPIPEALAPRDRVRGLRLGERDFPSDGESLYGVFCAACHGERAGGRRFGDAALGFPAIGNPDFLALVDDPFLRRTLMEGRPGRRMPAWGTSEGGLRTEEIEALLAYLRSLEPRPPSFDEVMQAPVDRELGEQVYRRDCVPCHGERGEGSALAPPLAAPDNPATKDDSRVFGTLTVGVAGTAMGSFRRHDPTALRSVIAWVRSLPPVPVERAGWAPRPGEAGRGAARYAENCASCHGARGEGPKAPAIGNVAFLATATDGYLAATIVRGREGTTMPAFGAPGVDHRALSAGEVADVVAFIRTL